MRLTHPTHLAALLAPLILATPLAAQIPGGLRTTARAQAPGNGNTIIVWPRHLQTLQARLDSFAVALPAAERALWEGVLLRAAHAPTPAAGEVRVTPVLEIGPGGGCEDPGMNEAANRVAIIVQGGRTAGASGIVVQGGRTATPATGIVVQGGRTAAGAAPGGRPAVGGRPGTEVRRPTEAVSIGPKQEDPTRPAPEMLGRRLTELSTRLPAEERRALEWLLTRAASAPQGRPATPGGLPPGAAEASTAPGQPGPGGLPPGPCMCATLRQALGIDVLSIGPKPEDPTRGRTEERWILRF